MTDEEKLTAIQAYADAHRFDEFKFETRYCETCGKSIKYTLLFAFDAGLEQGKKQS